MSFRNRVKRVMSRGSSSVNSPTESAFQSQEISRIQTPISSDDSFVHHDSLTIDPRENPLTLIESNATGKRRSALSRFRSAMKKEDPYANWPEEIYKPHELPRPKYRRPVDPEHKASLQAYSLRDAFANMRRKSGMSQYSPFGSRLHSRRNSFSSRAGRSALSSRNPSVTALVTADEILSDGTLIGSASVGSQLTTTIPSSQTTENQSRFNSRRRRDTVMDNAPVPELVPSTSMDSDDTDSSLYPSQPVSLGDVSRSEGISVAQFEKPFDEEELTRALTRKLVVENGFE